jgi:hypothetical protein
MPVGNRFTVSVIGGSAIYLYVNLFTFGGVPFLLGGDEVYFWTYGLRMLHGERIYQDFFTMHPPGTDLFYCTLFGLFGEQIWVTNLAVLVLGVILSWVCFRIASQIMEDYVALLATWLFLVLIYGKMLNGTHHWFSVLAVMGAVLAILPDARLWQIAFAGSLLGVASFFTQTRGPFALLGFAAFIVWDWHLTKGRWQDLLTRQILLSLSFGGTLALLSSYFIATTGFATLWYFQISYVRQHLARTGSLGLPGSLSLGNFLFVAPYLCIYVALPIAYAVALYRCWRGPATRNATAGMLLGLVGFCLLGEVAFNVNWVRVFVVSMPGIVLLVWVVAQSRRVRRYVVPVTWVALVCLGLTQTWLRHTHAEMSAELPGGRVALRSEAFEKLDWLARRTKPEDFFFQAAWTSFYLPLRLRNPVFLDLLESSAITSPEYVELTIQQLETRRVHYILWPPRLDAPDAFYGQKQYYLGPFRDYLQTHYHLMWSFSDNEEMWERTEPEERK